MKVINGWRPRISWGVSLRGNDDMPFLIGDRWHRNVVHKPRFEGERPRPLLFETRAQARAWCAEQHARYRGRNDSAGAWRFGVVRVRESWEIAP